jgi:hypothetical protein
MLGPSLPGLITLAGLKCELERHRGESRLVAWPKIKVEMLRDEAYRKLLAPGALFAQGLDDQLPDGSAYALSTADGEKLSGEVEFICANRGFCIRVAEWKDALLWSTIEGAGEIEIQL